MRVRDALRTYAGAHGREPSVVLLKNHGIFVTGDSPDAIRTRYAAVLDRLTDVYRSAGVSTDLGVDQAPDLVMIDFMIAHLRTHMGAGDLGAVRAAGSFTVVLGPLTPDHIVYARSYPLIGKPTAEALRTFREAHGYLPRIIANEFGVFAVGPTEKAASLALALAKDGAMVAQLAQVFGGVEFMTDQARDFIEHWEAEHYRHQLSI
jgi:rhamnose utilization protein RhaD (predicted bifunctional aldolase and dehydrogenase)